MKQRLLTLLSMLLSVVAFAQNGIITGKVKDSQSGEHF